MSDRAFITRSFEETQKAGEDLARSDLVIRASNKSKVIALYGELGSGKTTFVQGMAKGLGIKKRIISPTFTIVRSYKLKTPLFAQELRRGKQNSKVFYHID